MRAEESDRDVALGNVAHIALRLLDTQDDRGGRGRTLASPGMDQSSTLQRQIEQNHVMRLRKVCLWFPVHVTVCEDFPAVKPLSCVATV
jgi:hypothetical protein